jgi:hypothetical protein
LEAMMDFGELAARFGELVKDVAVLAAIVAFGATVVVTIERLVARFGRRRAQP